MQAPRGDIVFRLPTIRCGGLAIWVTLIASANLHSVSTAEDELFAAKDAVDDFVGHSRRSRNLHRASADGNATKAVNQDGPQASVWENLTARIRPSNRVPAAARASYAKPLANSIPQRLPRTDSVTRLAQPHENSALALALAAEASEPVITGTDSQPGGPSHADQLAEPASVSPYDTMAFGHLPLSETAACVDAHPVDLPTTLRLAGASNLQVAIARERVCEATANFKMANAMWLPSLNFGVGYNNHSGRIQATDGDVSEVSRSSLFTGGGVGISALPIAGGSGGPLRFGVDLSLSDALYEPLAARQRVKATSAAHSSTFNDILMQSAVAYLELVRGQAQRSIAAESVKNALELVRLTEAQQAANVGLPADVQRARAEHAFRRQQFITAEEQIGIACARLTRLLHLDACCQLCAQDDRPVPISLIDPAAVLCDLIEQAIAARPERNEALAVLDETTLRKEQEHFRPWLPNIHLGYSAGGFGGSPGSSIDNFGSRGDLDVLAIWQVRNMGLGTQALRAQANSRYRQACLAEANVRDVIGAEVSAAYYQVQSRLQQIEVTRRRVEAAAAALPLNFRGILGRQLRAIEAQQAIHALDNAWREHLDAIIRYNQAQFQLLRAVGRPANVDQVLPKPISDTDVVDPSSY